jgi:hypothetical protein
MFDVIRWTAPNARAEPTELIGHASNAIARRRVTRYTASVFSRRLIAAVVALAAVCALPQAARAQASPPDERAAAREYAYAAYRLRVKVKAAMPQMNATRRMLTSPHCLDALQGPKVTPRAEKQAETLIFDALIGGLYLPVAGALETFQHELDRVPTADPALVAGREQLRKGVEFALQVQAPPADVCARLAAWARSGYADAALPMLQPEPIHDFIANAPVTDGSETVAAPLRRAAARMVQLGVTKGQARRFSGETLFDGVDLGH